MQGKRRRKPGLNSPYRQAVDIRAYAEREEALRMQEVRHNIPVALAESKNRLRVNVQILTRMREARRHTNNESRYRRMLMRKRS